MAMVDEGGPSVVRVLGPIHVVASTGRAVELASASQRRLLGVLAVHAPHAVRAERLAAVLDLSPSGLRTSVTRLRRVLGPGALESSAGGYQLIAPVDAHRFAQALADVRRLTSAAPDARCRALRAALAISGGPALDEFATEDWAIGEATRLDEMHAAATEDLVESLVDAGRCAEAIATITEHIARLPLRDRRAACCCGPSPAPDARPRRCAPIGRTERCSSRRSARSHPLTSGGSSSGWPPDGTVATHTPPTSESVGRARDVPLSLSIARSGPFVGRDDLLADLLDGWRGGRWTGLVVAGEHGIGKTRLLAELAHAMHAEGATVAVGRCDEDAVLSYRPWTEVVTSLQAATAQTEVLDGELRHAALVDAVLALLRSLAPLVVVLDDLHWIDTPSLRVLQRVMAADLPGVTVLAAYRYTDVQRRDPLAAALADLRRLDGVRRLTIHGLDERAVEALVELGEQRGPGSRAPRPGPGDPGPDGWQRVVRAGAGPAPRQP